MPPALENRDFNDIFGLRTMPEETVIFFSSVRRNLTLSLSDQPPPVRVRDFRPESFISLTNQP
jgi:hypothetical protein